MTQGTPNSSTAFVVADDVHSSAAIATILSASGWEVSTTSRIELLANSRALEPVAVFLCLTEIDDATLGLIREITQSRRPFAIVVVRRVDISEDAVAALHEGAVDVVTAPAAPPRVLHAAKRARTRLRRLATNEVAFVPPDSSPPAPQLELRRVRVLIVGDPAPTQRFAALCPTHSVLLERIHDADRGLLRILDHDHDVVAITESIGGSSGIEFLRPVPDDVPSLLLTASPDDETSEAAAACGFREIVDLDTSTVDTVRAAIRGARERTESARAQLSMLHELESLSRQLLTINQSKDDMLAMLAHDQRNAIGIVLGYAKLLRKSPELAPRSRAMISKVLSAADYLRRLVDDMLDVDAIRRGRVAVKPQRCRLQPIVRRTIDLVEPAASAKNIEIAIQLAPDFPMVFCDPERTQQVLMNLLDNAIKFSTHGPIHVHASATDDGAVISVLDRGPGVPSSNASAVFRPFARGDARPTGGERTTGLGLAIARSLVERQGGDIGVAERAEGGSRFWFSLPYPPPARPRTGFAGLDDVTIRTPKPLSTRETREIGPPL